MNILIDSASAARRLDSNDFRAWARDRCVFISSVMDEFEQERRALAAALRDAGMRLILFEEIGGRDEDAERAYFAGVDQSDIYLGIIGDRYGRMQSDGRSPTHAEYLRARLRGKRISVWSREPSPDRQGHERDFLEEIRSFHTTGRFDSTDQLVTGVQSRLEEIASDDESPWVKLGDCVFRADRIRVTGGRVAVSATVRDSEVARHLRSARPDQWGQARQLPITTSNESGLAKIEEIVTETAATSTTSFEIAAEVEWGRVGGAPMMAGTSNYSAEDLVSIGIESGLLVTNLPTDLQDGFVGSMIDTSDPLRELQRLEVPEGPLGSIARLFVVERLVGGGFASHVGSFDLGPVHGGTRRVRLAYTEAPRYSNAQPVDRVIEGQRTWQ